MKNKGISTKKHIVTVTVKNGPFNSQTAAGQSRKVLTSRGVATTPIKKLASGYFFSSKVKYSCATVAIREKLIKQVRAFAKTNKMPESYVKITSR